MNRPAWGLRPLLLFLVVWLAVSCERNPAPVAPAANSARPLVVTSFYPTLYFTQRIAGDFVELRCPLPGDADPVHWKPDPASLALFQRAELIVLNGAGFEKWVDQVSLPGSRVLDTAAGFAEQFIEIEEVSHRHGPEGEHSHTGIDGHTWMDPVLGLAQATAIRDALVERWPAARDRFEAGFASLESDWKELDRAHRELGSAASGAPLLAAHPAYNYPARRYGWKLESLDLDPETPLSPEELDGLAKRLVHYPARCMLWEVEPIPAVRTALEQLGVESHVVSPAELLDEAAIAAGRDLLTIFREQLETLRICWRQRA